MTPAAAPDSIPAEPGAYILFMRLDKALPLDINRFSGLLLEPGRYAYCGSARGPGGLRARVGRHFSRCKTMRWHVDRLTMAATVDSVHLQPGGAECTLVRRLMSLGATAPVMGFGSSDCRRCPAHLLALPDGFDSDFAGLTTFAFL
jgi:Uri superfamily endonuclease